MNDVTPTLLSQYANSPILLDLINRFNEAVDPKLNIDSLFSKVLDIGTATGYGLDVLGRIVGVSRQVQVPQSGPYFGFDGMTEAKPFSQGGIFYSAIKTSRTFSLDDTAFRALILFKAKTNIAPAVCLDLNQAISTLFTAIGPVNTVRNPYVVDSGNMQMSYVFPFAMSAVDLAIAITPDLLPIPVGVKAFAVQTAVVPNVTLPIN